MCGRASFREALLLLLLLLLLFLPCMGNCPLDEGERGGAILIARFLTLLFQAHRLRSFTVPPPSSGVYAIARHLSTSAACQYTFLRQIVRFDDDDDDDETELQMLDDDYIACAGNSNGAGTRAHFWVDFNISKVGSGKILRVSGHADGNIILRYRLCRGVYG